ncbi:hypothetical protein [Flavobacterium sp. GP15]|uniref:hypothetical protein n=1 Tax=Flavobacterium sp. GP15 TaxID=2758567 RepID=UPI00165E97D4|nr:hypothetical protein [Flavobacterium sp. GP15]
MIIDSQIWKYELKTELENFHKFIENLDFNSANEELEFEDEDNDDDELLAEYSQVGNKVFLKLQKFTIYVSIIIRKLIEANKISDELLKENFKITSYLKIDNTKITRWNSFEIEKLYHLNSSKETNINLKNLTDKIIHSYHFMPKYNWLKYDINLPNDDIENWKNDGLEGFYFSSDFTKEKELFFITIKKFIEIINEVNLDFIVRKHYVENKLIINSRKLE